MTGIALGNYLGGKIADKYPLPSVLAAMFLIGSLLTVAILPVTKVIARASWFESLPVMLNFTLKTACIFFLPAVVLSMVSPLVIKLTLADLGQTGGIVGTIYAFSTVGAILGTFMTGFYFILWFGTRTIVWLVAGVLVLAGVLAWFSWHVPRRGKFPLKNFILWMVILEVVALPVLFFRLGESWKESVTAESNYYTIKVFNDPGDVKVLALDRLNHSYVIPDNPKYLKYGYLKTFAELAAYLAGDNPAPRVLHLGGGGYSFPRYMDTVYPRSSNEVVEIDPIVTEVAHALLGLPLPTNIKTYNQDARLFLMQRRTGDKYHIVIGDVFNDLSTPYHLTTLEFAKLVKSHMEKDGVYLMNIVDNFEEGKYLPSFIYTLKQTFDYVVLFGPRENWINVGYSTFVLVATDRRIDIADYQRFVTADGTKQLSGYPYDAAELDKYVVARNPVLLTDDHAPTDILVAPLVQQIGKLH